jgi:DNA-binding GntR family transcriptional regulator
MAASIVGTGKSRRHVEEGTAPKTLSADVFGRLREDLLAGCFAPDAKLRLEDLRQIYEVGFSPLREALMLLAANGLVVVEHQKGFRAAPITLEDLNDVISARQKIEAIALRDALEHGDDNWEAAIVAAFHRLGKVTHINPTTGVIDAEWARRHHAFHYALVAGARSRWIKRLWQTLYDQTDRYRRIAASSIPEGRLQEHERLMKAALRRDTELLLDLSFRHVQRTATLVANQMGGGHETQQPLLDNRRPATSS